MGRKASRNTSIEALRLVAVAGITIFHTFQWTFQATCVGLPEYAALTVFPYSGALGFINLLGCWANEVFFMSRDTSLFPRRYAPSKTVHPRKASRSNRLIASKRSSCPRSFIAPPACLFRCTSIPYQKSRCMRLAGSRWASSLSGSRGIRIARPSDCVDTAANRQQKSPVCRSTSCARNIWNQLLHRGDGKRSGRYHFVAQTHERRYLPGRVYCSWRNALCPRMPRQRIRRSKIQDRTHRTRCRHHRARASAIGKQPVQHALEALL